MNKILAYRLKEARKSKGMRQDDVAAELGFSRSYISDLENGKKKGSLETIEKLADLFDVSIEFLRGKEATAFFNEDKHFAKHHTHEKFLISKQKFRHILEISVESLTCSPQIRGELLQKIESAPEEKQLALLFGLLSRGLQYKDGLVEYLMSVFDIPPENFS